MNATEIIIFLGLAAVIIFTQVGRRPLTLRRIVLPPAVAGYAAYHFLQSIPTTGGDLDFEMALTLSGVALGVLAAFLMRVEKDDRTGRIVTEAGIAYASLWLVVLGGRLAFAWAATNLWGRQIGEFSIQHQITSSAAWTAAFVLMALGMVLARTAVVGGRALMASNLLPLRVVSES
jgi:hypothetical protein